MKFAFPWLLLFPTLAVLGVFVFYPLAQSVFLSVQEVDPFLNKSFFVGFENFRGLLVSSDYWQSLRTTLLFVSYTVIPSVILGLWVAILLDSNPYFQSLFRTLFLMPVAVSSAMAAMLWIFIYNPTAGYLGFTLERLGIQAPNWLGDPEWALIAVALVTVWKELGFGVIFFLAGLASIPNELKEAATLDGAKGLQRFLFVTLPILSPTVFFVIVVNLIHAFESFGQIHILTGGGPAGATTTLVYSLYRDAFINFRAGWASAQAVLLFFIMLLATIVQFRIAKRRVHYG